MDSKHICGAGLAILVTASFLFSACSVKEPPQVEMDDEELSSDENDSTSNDLDDEQGDDDSEKNKSSNPDDDVDWSSEIGDFGSDVESSFTFTQKVDCDFSVDDEKWFVSKTSDDDIGDVTFTFDEKAMHILFEAAGTDSTEEQCQSDVAAWQIILAIMQGTDVEASCDGLEFKGSGKLEDPSRPISKKKEVYAELCN